MARAISKKKPKRPVGNPVKPIDWEIVDRLAIGGANGAQIAARMGVHPDTLYERCEQEKGTNWSAYLTEKKQSGNSLLHNKQFDLAMKGNVSMLIWLGKQRLDQEDKFKQDVNAKHEISQKSFLELPKSERREEDLASSQ